MDVFVDFAVGVPIGVGGTGRFVLRAGPRAVRRIEPVAVGHVLFIVLRGEKGFHLGALQVHAILAAEAARRGRPSA